MKTEIPKIILAILEIVGGTVAAAFGLYFWLDTTSCSPDDHLCGAMTFLAVLIFLVPGIVVSAAGCVSWSSRRFAFWKVQGTMLGIVVAYFALLAGLAMAFSP